MNTSETHVLKFGGTSLQNPNYIKQSTQIVMDRTQQAHPFVVVSALEGVTDALIELTKDIGKKTDLIETGVDNLRQKHLTIFDKLTDGQHKKRNRLDKLFDELTQDLHKLSLDIENKRALKDRILSIGERASALIFASVLSSNGLPAESFEAHQFIKTDSTFGKAKVKQDTTRKLIREYLQQSKFVPVVTGFIGSDSQNRITTLGRSGSDYTAGLVADALNADHLEIWTDVNGVLSADPRWVPTAQSIKELSFGDITELSAHGAKVIHPQTIRPIQDKGTTVLVKNSYNPSHPGTSITSGFESNGALKTITVTGPFVKLQVDETHAFELFSKLTEWSEQETDSEAVGFKTSSEFEPARFILRQSFFEKVSNLLGQWASSRDVVLDLQSNLFKVKKFSNHFSDDESLSKRIWDLLVSNNLQPINAERNLDERFISFLFDRQDAQLAARLLNDYLQGDQKVIDLFVAGTGAVGHTLLKQLKSLEPEGITFRLIGACNSRNALWQEEGIALKNDIDWSDSEPTNWELLIDKLTAPHRNNLIFVDATGSEEVARLYPQLFENGTHIVTPSKLANTFEQAFFDDLQSLIKENNTSFRYETTAGAGLPVISTLNELQSAGDSITEISGVVSGTMTYLFNQLEQGVPFSEAIVDAREKGYAEPDPRDDLSGEDVARKFLTLARTLGYKIEREQIAVESLIPEALRDVDKDTFLDQLSNYDQTWEQRISAAQNKGQTLRYTGRFKDGKVNIGIEVLPKDSPIGQLKGTDNLIQIFSDLYNQTPLVIQGPGAGKEVTAAGVLADILKTARSLS
ncbi:aspartate kinase [Fodinibius halophilus]|uniref:Aspartate kinase n=1 Tax=Fodinibius halophilus TaxID=1736908 RepID=A0A6M1SZX0_9BACT|nr:aspartate kinase [Fodinibius halophilus]NGP89408.1 aspartate kinase [Fodinibius halophilus]